MAIGAALGAFADTRLLAIRSVTFADAVAAHQDEVYGAALRILGDRDAALEATNNAFFKAYRAFDRYDPSRPVRYWLLRIATNEALTIARARSRDLRRRADADAALEVADTAAAPHDVSVAREERARIRAAVATLPELYRVVIVLRYFSELSVEEIAAVTKRPASTVGVQLLRGRALLRAALGEGR
jgi:RNA polymerase sigma-70 factor (ECF subfamily)